MKQQIAPVFVPRPTCYRCFRPTNLCYCDDLPHVDNRTRVVIVQHPREQFHPLNTARIAEHGLAKSVVVRAAPGRMEAALAKHDVSPDAAILFPSDDAEELEELAPEEFPQEIIVVDGTWHHAKTLLRDVPALGAYRRIKFNPSTPSEYKIRKEPRADYLSTIESVSYVLRHVEPDTPDIVQLNHAFVKMIERNIAARKPSEEGTRVKRRQRQIPHRFPAPLVSDQTSFVVAYCEGASRLAQPRETSEAQGIGKEPLVVYLKRFGSGEALRLLLRTERIVPARLLGHLQLSEEDFQRQGETLESARIQIESFLQPGDVPVVWNASSRQILEEIGVRGVEPLVLKGAYCDYLTYQMRRGERTWEQGWGGMSDIIERLNVPVEAPSGAGRGPRRMCQTEALLGWICASASEHCEAFDS